MYIMMCEKYAMKFNWRGYTYNDEIRMLSFDGSFNPKALEVIRSSLKDLGINDNMPEVAQLYAPGFQPVK